MTNPLKHILLPLLFLGCVVGGGCGKPEKQFSYSEYAKIELDAMEEYKRMPSEAAVVKLKSAYEYYDELCEQGHKASNDSNMGIIVARLAFLYNHLDNSDACVDALDRCKNHIKDVGVRGETDSRDGKIVAFIQVVKDFDKDYGVTWSANLIFDKYLTPPAAGSSKGDGE